MGRIKKTVNWSNWQQENTCVETLVCDNGMITKFLTVVLLVNVNHMYWNIEHGLSVVYIASLWLLAVTIDLYDKKATGKTCINAHISEQKYQECIDWTGRRG